MLAQFGNLSLILASVSAGLMLLFGMVRTEQDPFGYSKILRQFVWAQFIFTLASFLILITLLVICDFSVAYVAQHSNLRLPTFYKVTAAWGAHEGSLLMWNLVLSGWAVTLFRVKNISAYLIDKTFAIQGLLLLGFLLFTLFTSSPFVILTDPPLNGGDLNPVLQDPAMVIHPPMLYFGYVGFSIPFAYVVAMLWTGEVKQKSLRWIRPWVVWPWVFLTVGIALGSWWAYYELGWGGWWFWDPVENASLMPWIAATALLHSLAVTEKRGLFLHWTLLLAVLAFALSVLGSFLVRSGVMISVHSFASDPTRGLFILALFAIFVGLALFLYAFKTPIGFKNSGFGLLSRESFLLINNLLLAGMLILVMLGTLYPLIVDGLGLGKISVGPPYFDHVMLYVCLPIVGFLVLGQHLTWKRQKELPYKTMLLIALILSLFLTVAVIVLKANLSVVSVIGLFLSVWLLFSSFIPFIKKVFQGTRLSPSIMGMSLAHVGVAVFALGVILTNQLSLEKTTVLKVGESYQLGDYKFSLQKLTVGAESNYQKTEADFNVTRNLQTVASLYSQKRFYPARQTTTTEAGIKPGFLKDIYVTIGEPLSLDEEQSDSWSFHLQIKPFVRWIWLGTFFMALGGIIAISDKRYRVIDEKNASKLKSKHYTKENLKLRMGEVNE